MIKNKILKAIEDWIQECRNNGILIGGFREEKLKQTITLIIGEKKQ